MSLFERIGGLVVTVLACAALVGCAGAGSDKAGGARAARPVVLTMADFLGGPDETTGFVAELDRLSHGKLRIDVENNWRLGQVAYETGLIDDVRAGRADIGIVGSRAWDSVGVVSFRVLTAPLLIDSYTLQNRVLMSPLIAQMLRGLEPLGLVGIGVLPGPLRHPLGFIHPLLRPSDYAGLRIGVQQSLLGNATMRALGADPVPFAVSGSIAGLGGIEQQISSIQGNQYDHAGSYLTANVALWPRPLVLFANGQVFSKLTVTERRILVQAATTDIPREAGLVTSSEVTDTDSLCRSGRLRLVSASGADLAALRRAVQPIYASLGRDRQTRRFVAEIEAIRRAYPPQPAAQCPAAAGPQAAASALDGTWELDTKIGDDPTDPQPVPENYGHWVFVFDRGRFADTQIYRDACTWAYGTMTVTRGRMAWTFTDGGGIAPTNATNKPGEFFRFGWSLYRDTLTLTPVPGAVSPNGWIIKAWHRISTAPLPGYLSRRCPPPANALPHGESSATGGGA